MRMMNVMSIEINEKAVAKALNQLEKKEFFQDIIKYSKSRRNNTILQ